MRCFIANACENANRAELKNLQNDNLEFLHFRFWPHKFQIVILQKWVPIYANKILELLKIIELIVMNLHTTNKCANCKSDIIIFGSVIIAKLDT